MYFKEIELENFRNYKKQKIKFHDKINIITGKNAQGKTNLIEALYIMSLGKSFRTSKDNEFIRFGCNMARIKTLSYKDGNDLEIEIAFIKNKKSLKIDNIKKKKLSDILKNVYIVIFSPDDLKIVKEEPDKRRRFIDRELCQIKPIYYDNLLKYKKILAQRNHLLKEEHINTSVLDVWDSEMAEYGSRIIIEREKFTKELCAISKKIHSDITDDKENLNIEYESNIDIKENFKEQKSFFLETLKKNRKNDIFRRNSSKGPHRDDLKIEIDNIDVRSFASQGQQRSAALSLKLAELNLIYKETGEKPILLLDDVLSELDKMRQSQLINLFGDIQIFITTTEITEDLKNNLPDHVIFEVENGMVNRVK